MSHVSRSFKPLIEIRKEMQTSFSSESLRLNGFSVFLVECELSVEVLKLNVCTLLFGICQQIDQFNHLRNEILYHRNNDQGTDENGLTQEIMPKLREKLVKCTKAAARVERNSVPRALPAIANPMPAILTYKFQSQKHCIVQVLPPTARRKSW